jgi:ribosomal protein S18 acetylase RimI-like enzyme
LENSTSDLVNRSYLPEEIIEQIDTVIVDNQDQQISAEIWNLLVTLDDEFVPPLSARNSTVAMILNGSEHHHVDPAGPKAYYQEVLNQVVLLARIDGACIGLMAFRHCCIIKPIAEFGPCNYITTVGVMPEVRSIGVARLMYNYLLFDLPGHWKCQRWATRTWSTNDDHILLLKSLDFRCVKILKNHRGPGVDTMYFEYHPKR